MKYIEVIYREKIRQLAEDFVTALLDDLKKSAPQINFTSELVVALINKCVDQMNSVQSICLKKKRAEIEVVRLELEIFKTKNHQSVVFSLNTALPPSSRKAGLRTGRQPVCSLTMCNLFGVGAL